MFSRVPLSVGPRSSSHTTAKQQQPTDSTRPPKPHSTTREPSSFSVSTQQQQERTMQYSYTSMTSAVQSKQHSSAERAEPIRAHSRESFASPPRQDSSVNLLHHRQQQQPPRHDATTIIGPQRNSSAPSGGSNNHQNASSNPNNSGKHNEMLKQQQASNQRRNSSGGSRTLMNASSSSSSSSSSKIVRYPSILVDLSNCRYEVIRHVFENMLGFEIISFNTVSASCAVTDMLPGSRVYWSDRSLAPMRVHKLLANRCTANHFPGIEQLCRKVSMGKMLSAMRVLFPSEYDFFPKTFVSYDEYCSDVARRRDQDQKPSDSSQEQQLQLFYICKPNGGCCGRNILITKKPTPWLFDGVVRPGRIDGEIVSSQGSGQIDPCVVQEYISRPLLVHHRKCDLRCYVLIASLEPFVVYFYKEGIVRMCATDYQYPCDDNITDASMHLANYAVNKKVTSRYGRDNSSNGKAVKKPIHEGVDDDNTPGHDGYQGEESVAGVDGEDHEQQQQRLPLKHSFDYYNRYLMQHIQRCPQLLARGEAAHTAAHGRRASSVPHVLIATHMIDALWSRIHELAVKAILSGYKTLRKHMPASAAFSSSGPATSLHTIPSPPPPPATDEFRGIGGGSTLRRSSNDNSSSSCAPMSTSRSTTTGTGPGSSSVAATAALESAVLQSSFFEILGFDILVDEDLKPWLVEINHSPSWGTDAMFDFELKRRVLRDALNITLLPRLRAVKQQKHDDYSTRSRGSDEPCGDEDAEDTSGRGATPTSPTESSCSSRRNLHSSTRRGSNDFHVPRGGGRGSRRSELMDALRAAKEDEWTACDEEYAAEGNRFQLIFPTKTMQSNLAEVLEHQGIRNVV